MGSTVPPLFIVGAPRSGNTLLRRVLMASDQIYIPPETYVVGEILHRWPQWSKLKWHEKTRIIAACFEHHKHFEDFEVDSFRAFVRLADGLPESERTPQAAFDCLYKFMAQEHGFTQTRWGDKTPWNTMFLKDIVKAFPDAYYLHVYRDGRDVVASQVKAEMRDVAQAAQRWTQANFACQKYLKLAKRQPIQIRYESLVRNPEAEFLKLFEWADLDFDPDYLVKIPKKLGDVGRHEHHAAVKRPITADSIGAWRKSLAASDFAALPPNFNSLLVNLGYSTD